MTTALQEFTTWCAGERAKLRRQIEALESGKLNLFHRNEGVDCAEYTAQEIRRLEKKIADLELS
jgi:hypothetical protein